MTVRNALPRLVLCAVLTSACGGAHTDEATPVAAAERGRPDAHFIEPEDVAGYVEEFERARERVRLEIDGRTHPLRLLSFDTDRNEVFLGWEGGYVRIGVDFEAERALPELRLAEADDTTNEEAALASTTRVFVTEDVLLDRNEAGDEIYRARMTDEKDSEHAVDVELVGNDSILKDLTWLSYDDDSVTINGFLTVSTYVLLRDMIATRPEIERLVFGTVHGSLEDEINFHTGRLVREAGLDTHVPAEGSTVSGGVDLFMAGVRRTVEPGGILGIHSWCCDEEGVPGDELPADHPSHDVQETYARDVLGEGGEAFYRYQLQAAPYDGMHRMTREEMERFGVVTD